MDPILAAKVWHYWLSFALVGGAVLTTLMLLVGYLVKVTAQKYPKQ
ncbi:MAG: hypothetical protein KY443_05735 [Actinobacteria bacterium]|nr:hypothetical protein [Actinomycetota bacterium]